MKSKWIEHLPIAAITLFSLFWFRLPFYNSDAGTLTYDSVFFLKMAYHLVHFGEFGWIGFHEPCFYSILVAIFSFFSSTFLNAGILVSRISVLLLIFITYLLSKEFFNKRVAVASALLLASMPHIYVISNAAMSESLYALLLTLSVYLLWKAYRQRTLFLSIATGVSFSLAYLTRSEGLFIMLFLLVTLVFAGWKEKSVHLKPLVLVAVTFLIISTPYFFYLKSHYGHWTIGTKTSSIYFWVREKVFHDPDPDKTEWNLSPEGELNMISMTSKDVIGYWLKDPERSIRAYLKNLKEEIPGFIPKSSITYHYPQVYPVYFAIPLIIGLLIRLKEKRFEVRDVYLLTPFLILFIFPLLTGGWWRYLVNYLPLFTVLAAKGWDETVNKATSHETSELEEQRKKMMEAFFWLPLIAVALYHFSFVMSPSKAETPKDVVAVNSEKQLVSEERRKAALWANKRFPEYSNYMADWTRLPYYLEGRWTPKPDAPLDETVKYAKKYSADYIVFETSDENIYRWFRRLKRRDLVYSDAYISTNIYYYALFMKVKK